MSSQWLEVDGLSNDKVRFATRSARPAITWWPTSLPGSDLDERARRRKPSQPTKRRIRRGRIQLVAG